MDFLGAMKTIEQFVYELMSWVLFYPLTMLRVLIRPMQMTDYVLIESGKDEKEAFSTAIRPTLFLLLSQPSARCWFPSRRRKRPCFPRAGLARPSPKASSR